MTNLALGRMAEVALTVFARELALGLVRIIESQVNAKSKQTRRGRKRSR